MSPYMRDERQHEVTATSGFTRLFIIGFLTAAAIGLAAAVVWIVTGLLHFHPLW